MMGIPKFSFIDLNPKGGIPWKCCWAVSSDLLRSRVGLVLRTSLFLGISWLFQVCWVYICLIFVGSQVIIYIVCSIFRKKRRKKGLFNLRTFVRWTISWISWVWGTAGFQSRLDIGIHGFDLIESPLFRSCNLAGLAVIRCLRNVSFSHVVSKSMGTDSFDPKIGQILETSGFSTSRWV